MSAQVTPAAGLVIRWGATRCWTWRPVHWLCLLFLWVFAQDLLTMLAGQVLPPELFKIAGRGIVMGKEALVVGGVLYLALPRARTMRWVWPDLFAVAIGALALVYVTIPNAWLGGPEASLTAKVVSARLLLVAPLLYCFARWLPLRRADLAVLMRLTLRIGVIALLAGFVLTALPSDTWHQLGLGHVYEIKYAQAGSVGDDVLTTDGFPLGWFFQDLPESLVPKPGLRRLSSLVVEPIATGLIMAVLFIMSVALAPRRRLSLTALLFGAGVALALSRGGWLLAFLGYVLVRVRKPLVVVAVGASALAAGLLVYSFILPSFGFNTYARLRGGAVVADLAEAVEYPQGRGLGTIGYFSTVFTGESPLAQQEELHPFAYESFVGTLGIQLGILGVVLWVGFFVALVRVLQRITERWQERDVLLSRMALGVLGSVIGMGIIGFVTASGYGFVGLVIPFSLAGAVVGVDRSLATSRH